MNAEQSACAPSRRTATPWNQINWSKCAGNVRRLQARIVKATRENRWGKVRALQWQLTHSFSGKALAVKRVTQNQGKLTPGVDRVIWDTPQAKHEAIGSLRRCGYQPQPLRRVYIPKANGKKRPVGIPTMKDRAMQALHLLALAPVAETTADRNSYGFRPLRATADADPAVQLSAGKEKEIERETGEATCRVFLSSWRGARSVGLLWNERDGAGFSCRGTGGGDRVTPRVLTRSGTRRLSLVKA
jgi:hypothetical protein